MNAVHDDDCFLSGGDDGRFPCICKPPVQIAKCQCGDSSCGQYTLSTQGSVGFSLEDATLYAASDDILSELKALYRAYVQLLESGRDRIRDLGGDCDSVDRMEQGDPALIAARATIAKAAAGEAR